MSLDNLVIDISVSLGSPPVTRQGFGTPMVLMTGLGAGFTERIRYYTTAAAAAADTDLSAAAIAKVSAGFAQEDSPSRIGVGRREANVAQDIAFTVTGATDGDYTITINSLPHTFTASSSTVSAIVAGLVALINTTGVDLGAIELTFTDNGDEPDTIELTTGSWADDYNIAEGTTLTPAGTASNNTKYTVATVSGKVATLVASDSVTDESAVTTSALVASVSDLVTATDSDPDVDVVADTAGIPFTYSSTSDGSSITETVTTANVGVVSELTAVYNADSDWFGFCLDSRNDAEILEAARDFAEPFKRLFFAQTDAAAMITAAGSDVGSDLKRRSLRWTAVTYYSDDSEHFDIAWLSKFLANDFDEVAPTAALNTIAGISTEELGDTAQGYLDAKNINYYTTLKGIGATANGLTAAGFDIEHVVTGAWYEARISENIAQLFLNVSNDGGRIRYNDQGFQQVGAVVDAVLTNGEDIGHATQDTSELEVPKRADVSAGDAASGILRISFGAQYSGRVKTATISGTVSTDFESLTA